MKRRKFVKSTAAFATMSLFIPNISMAASYPTGLQLYTVRDQMGKDVAGTIEKVAKIGYTIVEGAGYDKRAFYGMPPKDFRQLLSDNGLKMPSGHITSPFLKNQADETFEDAAMAGNEYVILAWLFPEERRNIEDYKKIIELVNNSYEVARKHGIKLGYHNHDFEFESLDGQIPYDLMMNEFPEDLPMELDLYWVTKAGLDPVEIFKKYPNRFPLWHVKDMADTPEQEFTEVGNGVIDFQRIFDNSKISGLKYFYVEQDQSRAPLRSISISYSNVQKINK